MQNHHHLHCGTRRTLLRAGAAISVMAPALALLAPATAQAQSGQPTQLSLRDITHDPLLPALGNAEGDITIVKFFDYQCAYCKRGHVSLKALLEKDPKVRVVMRDLFVYGETSRMAARLALASAPQGKYAQVVHALLGHSGRLSEERTYKVLKEQDVDLDAAKQWVTDNSSRIEALFTRNQQLARVLGFRGTPSYLIGHLTVPGGISLEQMEKALAQARAEMPKG